MFGYLPAPCRCQVGDRVDLYRSIFCGLCNALAGQYGPPARFLINRDSAFVALLAAAQAPAAPAATLSTRCQPWRRPLPVFEHGPIPAFAGAVALCGLQAKLDDERADGRGLRATGSRLLCALARPRFERAQDILAASGFPVSEIRQQLDEQTNIEACVAAGDDPTKAAQPTAQAFSAILAHTAALAGHVANAGPLSRVGHSLGELVYTLDAYQDLKTDSKYGRFNYLAMRSGSTGLDSLDKVRTLAGKIAATCQQQIRQAWAGVELLRYRPVLESVLLTRLAARTDRILAARSGPLLIGGGDSEDGRAHRGSSSCWDIYYCPGGNCSGCDACCCNDCDCDAGCCDCSSCCDCSGCDCSSCDCGSCDCSGCDCGGCDCSS